MGGGGVPGRWRQGSRGERGVRGGCWWVGKGGKDAYDEVEGVWRRSWSTAAGGVRRGRGGRLRDNPGGASRERGASPRMGGVRSRD